MRCGCGYLHANIKHNCNAKPSPSRKEIEKGRCSDCTCPHVPCRTCWVNTGYLAHKFDIRFADAIKRGGCEECGATLSNQSR